MKNFLFLRDSTSLSGHSLPVVHSPIPITVIRFKYKPLLCQPALKHSDISFTFSIYFHSLLIRLCLEDANYDSTHYLIMLIHTIIWTDFPFYLSAPRTNLPVLSPVPFSCNLYYSDFLLFFSYYIWEEFMILYELLSDTCFWLPWVRLHSLTVICLLKTPINCEMNYFNCTYSVWALIQTVNPECSTAAV